MIFMVLTKSKLKKIFSIILFIVLAVIAGFVFINQNTRSVFNMIVGMENPYERGTKKDCNYVALTINVDLGWETEYIDKLLEVLEKENVKASFNVTGKWAEKNKDELLKIKEKGHTIGNHGYEHLDYSRLSYDDNLTQITKAKNAIESIINEPTRFFQAPAGAFGQDTVRAAKKLGYIPFKWDADTIDWKYREQPDVIIDRIKNKELKSGSIILMHPTKATTEALDDIIQIIRDKGLEAGSLNDVFE